MNETTDLFQEYVFRAAMMVLSPGIIFYQALTRVNEQEKPDTYIDYRLNGSASCQAGKASLYS